MIWCCLLKAKSPLISYKSMKSEPTHIYLHIYVMCVRRCVHMKVKMEAADFVNAPTYTLGFLIDGGVPLGTNCLWGATDAGGNRRAESSLGGGKACVFEGVGWGGSRVATGASLTTFTIIHGHQNLACRPILAHNANYNLLTGSIQNHYESCWPAHWPANTTNTKMHCWYFGMLIRTVHWTPCPSLVSSC